MTGQRLGEIDVPVGQVHCVYYQELCVPACAVTHCMRVTAERNNFVNDDDYAKLLLDASFKEAEAFWKRNTVFLVTEGAFAGLYIKEFNPQSGSLFLALVAGAVGLVLAAAHFRVLRASQHYNTTWYNGLCNFANAQASQSVAKPAWSHLLATLGKNAAIRGGHSTQWAVVLPWTFAIMWITLFGYALGVRLLAGD